MRFLLTGASGFIGRNLLLSLPKRWKTVAVYHRSKNFISFLRQKGLRQVRSIRCDLTNSVSLKRQKILMGGTFDTCLYLAANGDPTLSVTDPERDLQMTVLTLLHFLSYVKVKRLVYVSSGAVYVGNRGHVSPKTALDPHLPYAISHLAAEQYVKSFCLQRKNPREYLIVRFFGAYGPYEPPRKIYTRLAQALADGKCRSFLIRGDGKNLIDAMYVTDAVEALLRTVRSPLKNTTFDLCSGHPLPIAALVQTAASVLGGNRITLQKRGATVEPIHFRGSPRFQRERLHFVPKVSLEAGFQKLSIFLKKEKR